MNIIAALFGFVIGIFLGPIVSIVSSLPYVIPAAFPLTKLCKERGIKESWLAYASYLQYIYMAKLVDDCAADDPDKSSNFKWRNLVIAVLVVYYGALAIMFLAAALPVLLLVLIIVTAVTVVLIPVTIVLALVFAASILMAIPLFLLGYITAFIGSAGIAVSFILLNHQIYKRYAPFHAIWMTVINVVAHLTGMLAFIPGIVFLFIIAYTKALAPKNV